MSFGLKVAIALAHFSIYIVVAISIWVFAQRSDFYQHTLKLRSLPSIYWGYVCFAVATSYEVSEHMNDDWFYISQLSGLNNLFYSFIVFGIGLISLGLRKNTLLDIVTIACMVATPIIYGVNDSKSLLPIPQLIMAAVFVYKWYAVMKDWRVFLYLLFSNVISLGFGIALIATGNQVFHLFIGPAGGIALLILAYVTWVQPSRYKQRQQL